MSWKTKNKREDEINEQLWPEETEDTKGNDLKNNCTKDNGKQKKKSLQRKTAANLGADELNQKATRFLL